MQVKHHDQHTFLVLAETAHSILYKCNEHAHDDSMDAAAPAVWFPSNRLTPSRRSREATPQAKTADGRVAAIVRASGLDA